MSRLYETDFYAWANEQAALLRGGKLPEADIAHIAEEIESMEKRELVSRLTVLLLHLLKSRFQPALRGKRQSRFSAATLLDISATTRALGRSCMKPLKTPTATRFWPGARRIFPKQLFQKFVHGPSIRRWTRISGPVSAAGGACAARATTSARGF